MDGSKTGSFVQEICDLKHKSLEAELAEVKEDVESITSPSTGYIAVAIEALEKKIDKLDAKVNGLIMFLCTTGAGAVVSIGAEFLKKFI